MLDSCGIIDVPWLSPSYLTYDRGGLKCPNPLWYKWAAQLTALMFYFTEGEGDWRTPSKLVPSYLPLLSKHKKKKKTLKEEKKKSYDEKHDCSLSSSQQIFMYPLSLSLSLSPSLSLSLSLSVFSRIWRNVSFLPGTAEGEFKYLVTKGLWKIGDLYSAQKVLMRFEDIVFDTEICISDFWNTEIVARS